MSCYVCGSPNLPSGIVCGSCRKTHFHEETINVIVPELHVSPLRAAPLPDLDADPDPAGQSRYSDEKEDLAIAKAERLGMEILRGNGRCLQLDLDSENSYLRFQAMLPMVALKFGVINHLEWFSKSGPPHRHVLIQIMQPLDAMARVALQALLGSDPRRECLNIYKHVVLGKKEPNLLFRPKEERS